MARCHLPHCGGVTRGWLLTDARLGGDGCFAARHLPPGSNIIVRSDALACGARRGLLRQLRRIARVRQCAVFLACADPAAAQRLGADGVHLRTRSAQAAAQARRLGMMTSAPVHNRAEARAAARAGIDYALVSPLHATRSHEGAITLSVRQWQGLTRLTRAQAVALGGMTPAQHRRLMRRCAGIGQKPEWAAIDYWDLRAKLAQGQKRNWVPT